MNKFAPLGVLLLLFCAGLVFAAEVNTLDEDNCTCPPQPKCEVEVCEPVPCPCSKPRKLYPLAEHGTPKGLPQVQVGGEVAVGSMNQPSVSQNTNGTSVSATNTKAVEEPKENEAVGMAISEADDGEDESLASNSTANATKPITQKDDEKQAVKSWETTPSKFSYNDHGDSWTGKCLTGYQQSPIDIVPKGAHPVKVDPSGVMQSHYVKYEGNLKIVNTGKVIELKGKLGYVDLRKARYPMRELTFHAPSEHTIEGDNYPLELQIYHQKENAAGNNEMVAISILFQKSLAENTFLKSLNASSFPKNEGDVTELSSGLDLNDLRSSLEGDQMVYMGSRTVPGCEETVEWHVCSSIQPATETQLDAIRSLFGKSGNNRQMQLTGTRKIYLNAIPFSAEHKNEKGAKQQDDLKRRRALLRKQLEDMYLQQQQLEGISKSNATMQAAIDEMMGLKSKSDSEVSVYDLDQISAQMKERQAKTMFALAAAKEKAAEEKMKKADADSRQAATSKAQKEAEEEAKVEEKRAKALAENDVQVLVQAMRDKLDNEGKSKDKERLATLANENANKNRARILRRNREMRSKRYSKLISQAKGKDKEEMLKKAQKESATFELEQKAEESEKALQKIKNDKQSEEKQKNEDSKRGITAEIKRQKEEARKRELEAMSIAEKAKAAAEQTEKEKTLAAIKEQKEKDRTKKELEIKKEQARQRKLLAEKEAETKREENKKAAEKQKEESAKEQKEKEKKKEEGEKAIKAEETKKAEEKEKTEQKIKKEKAAEQKKKETLKEAQKKQDAKVAEETEKFEISMEAHTKRTKKEQTRKEVSQKKLAARRAAIKKEEVEKKQLADEEEKKHTQYEAQVAALKKQQKKEEETKEKAKKDAAAALIAEQQKKKDLKANALKLANEKIQEQNKKREQVAESKKKAVAEEEAKEAKLLKQKTAKEIRDRQLKAQEEAKKELTKKEEDEKKAAAAAAKAAEEKKKSEQAEKKRIATEKEQKAKKEAADRAEKAAKKKAAEEKAKAAEAKTKYGQKISLQDKVLQYGKDYDVPIFTHYKKHLCLLSGVMLVEGEMTVGRILGKVPEECVPEENVILPLHFELVMVAVDILKDGTMKVRSVNTNQGYQGQANGLPMNGYLSLDGAIYPKTGAEVMDIRGHNGWTRQAGLTDPLYYIEDGLCVFTGVIGRVAGYPNPIARLPYECRPNAQLIFGVAGSNGNQKRINIHQNGYIYYDHGVWGSKYWLGLDNIAFYPQEYTNNGLQLGYGFSVYGYGHRNPGYTVKDNYCVVTGLIRGACPHRLGCHVLTLPEICRPYRKVMATINEHQYQKRLDVHPDGRVFHTNGHNHHGWISLDGLRFVTVKKGKKSHEYDEYARSTGLRHQSTSNDIELNSKIWQPFGSGFRAPQVSRAGGLCILSGLVKGSDMRTVIGTVGGDCAPKQTLMLDRHTAGRRTVRYDLDSKGELKYAAGYSDGGWVALDGIIYPSRKKLGTSMFIVSPYVNYNKANVQGLFIYEEDGLCVLTGTVRHVSWGTMPGGHVCTVPPNCRPDMQLIFRVNSGPHSLRLDIHRNGEVIYHEGSRTVPYVSLTGMAWFARSSSLISLHNGWRPYTNNYRYPSYRVVGRLCVLSGLVTGANHNHIAFLPQACRPKERLVFNVLNSGYDSRVDVYDDGRLVFTEGRRGAGWVSLDGIQFIADHPAIPASITYNVTKAVTTNMASNKMLAAGVTDYGGEYLEAQENWMGKMCKAQGLIRTSNPQGTYLTLSKNCRPEKPQILETFVEGYFQRRYDVAPNGELKYVSGEGSKPWVSLTDVFFPVKGAQINPLILWHNWVPFGKGQQAPGYVRIGSFCMLTGVIRADDFSTSSWSHQRYMLRIPAECRPKEHIIFHVNSNAYSHRINVNSDGWLNWVTGSLTYPFISLSGIGYFIDTQANPLSMVNGYRNYGYGHRAPSWKKEGNLCSVSGLAYGRAHHVANLPTACRPTKRLILSVNHHNYNNRIDVLPNGQILRYGSSAHGWLSLDGITFVVPTWEEPPKSMEGYESKEGTPLKLKNGFKPHRITEGTVWRNPMYTMVFNNTVCMLGGVVAGPALKSIIAVLPEECRPPSRISFNIDTSDYGNNAMRLDVWPDGRVGFAGGDPYSYIPLEGVMFAVKDKTQGKPLSLRNNLVSFEGEGFTQATYRKINGICFYEGMIRYREFTHIGSGSHLVNTPPECRTGTNNYMIMNANNGGHMGVPIWLGDHRQNFMHTSMSSNSNTLSLQDVIFVQPNGGVGNTNTTRSAPVSFRNGYHPYGGGYRRARVDRIENVCMLTGLIRGSSRLPMLELPYWCRPKETLRFGLNNHNYQNLVNVYPDGRVVIANSVHHNWVSLDGMRFVVPESFGKPAVPTNDDTKIKEYDLKLLSNFKEYGRKYIKPVAYRFGNICMLSGLARGGDMRGRYAQIPEECLPTGHLAFDGRQNSINNAIRYDISTDGYVSYAMGAANGNWFSFDGMIYPAKDANTAPLPLVDWYNYGHGMQRASYSVQKNLCVLQGFLRNHGSVANNGARGNYIGRVPDPCRPSGGRLIFTANHGNYMFRVDVLQDGQIHAVTWNGYPHTFLTLNGMNWFNEHGDGGSHVAWSTGWGNYNHGYRNVKYTIQGDVCGISGLANGNGASILFRLPEECRPKNNVLFTLNHHYEVNRIMVSPAGVVSKVDGIRRHSWISISGMIFARQT